MGLGRSCIIVSFPMLATVATIVLAVIAFLGCYPHASALDNVYFMRLNFTNISTSSITGLSGTESAAVDSAVSGVLKELGLPDFYNVGGNGYCQGSGTKVANCSSPNTPFWFDLATILEQKLPSGVSIQLPSDVEKYSSTLHGASTAMWICYIVGIALSGVQLVAGFFSFHSRGGSCCAALIGIIAAVFLVLASGLATGIYTVYKKYFNQSLNDFGVKATTGTTGFVLTWIATGLAILSAILWIFSICVGSTRRTRSVEEEKQPFIGYVPHPRY